MHTYRYLGWFIHENITAGTFKVQHPTTFAVLPAKSLHSAKCIIALNS